MYHVMYMQSRAGEKPICTILSTKKTIAEALEVISGYVVDGMRESKLVLVEQIDFTVEVKTNIGYNERGL